MRANRKRTITVKMFAPNVLMDHVLAFSVYV